MAVNFLRQPSGWKKRKGGGEKIPGPGERKFLFTLRCVSLAYRRKVHALTMEKTRQRSNLPGRGGEGEGRRRRGEKFARARAFATRAFFPQLLPSPSLSVHHLGAVSRQCALNYSSSKRCYRSREAKPKGWIFAVVEYKHFNKRPGAARWL